MANEYIGSPMDFHHMEGSESVNFRKTFDLNGTQNDEMLRLYLRKAGLSDEIEHLTAEQRRAFIYDIIKSNKMPGYWLPSTMRGSNNSYEVQRPTTRPPPPPPTLPTTPSPYMEQRFIPDSQSQKNVGMRTSMSTGNLLSISKSSPILPQRFTKVPATPPSPSTFVTSSRGIQYEISGPMNFQHTAGDMTRDMTRNAFDLSPSSNDNVLRKYMMERGISEEDVSGMRKTDLIRKIVQSKFTWIPTKKKSSKTQNSQKSSPQINYATISGYPNNQQTRPPLQLPPSPKTPTNTESKPNFSNFTLVTSRFADPAKFPDPETLYGTNDRKNSYPSTIPLPPLPPGAPLPAAPPRKSQYSSTSLPSIKKNAPPPPLAVVAQVNMPATIYQTRQEDTYDSLSSFKTPTTQKQNEPLYSVVSNPRKGQHKATGPPTPTKPKLSPMVFPSTSMSGQGSSPAPVPVSNMGNIPPPPPPMSGLGNIPPPPPMSGLGNIPPPPPMSGLGNIPPPPPPMMQPKNALSNNSKSNQNNNGVPPPPALPKGEIAKSSTTQPSLATNANEDSRYAFLESIRKGVTLKKVDQKAATISGAKARSERRPQITDFLTELKMGVTARRIKNPEDNPLSNADNNSEWND